MRRCPFAVAALAVVHPGYAADPVVLLPSCRKGAMLHGIDANGSRQLMLFGGRGAYYQDKTNKAGQDTLDVKTGVLGDSWLFDTPTSNWSPQQKAMGDAAPKPRWKGEGTDIGDGNLVLFAGCEGQLPTASVNDLWVFSSSSGTWRLVDVGKKPMKRRGHGVVKNSTHLFSVGGKTYKKKAKCTRSVYALPLDALEDGADVSEYSWSREPDFPGACRWGHTTTVVQGANGEEVLALFGGRNLIKKQYHYYAELWLYNFATRSWSLQTPAGAAPEARDHHGATRLGSDLFIFAGRFDATHSEYADVNDVWSFSATHKSWTLHASGTAAATSATRPSRRYMPGMAAGSQGGEAGFFIFGGQTLPFSTKNGTMNDVWFFSTKGGWEQLVATNCKDTPLMQHGVFDMSSASSAIYAGLGAGCAAMLVGLAVLWRRCRRTPEDTEGVEAREPLYYISLEA